MRVFIVDDSVVVRQAVTKLLTRLAGVRLIGYAETASQAISEIARLKPDVVVLDIQLKESRGIDVLVNIKRELPGVVVVVYAAFPSPHLREQYLKAGADYFFDKVTEVDGLTETVKQLAQHFSGGSQS